MPQGALKHELHHRAGPISRDPSSAEDCHVSQVVGMQERLYILPHHSAEVNFLEKGGRCEPFITNKAAGGWAADWGQ